ncbi:hypothetical protein E2C01_056953 [Portunus trituberculatus]|uniref:Uncharacterized protein n=1 Tax=Portunus trituberculatus TaxID=210409 RepID=A0A5B7GYS2_PORTR|nr:hypothetical protein [Portunus trituberculatus]
MHKCVPQKNSQNRTVVGDPCGGESSFLLRPEDDVSRARSATSQEPERARETTYWDDNGSERWLLWTGYLVPMRTNRFKKRPHMMQNVCPRQDPFPKHPSLDTQPSSTGRPLLGNPSSGG